MPISKRSPDPARPSRWSHGRTRRIAGWGILGALVLAASFELQAGRLSEAEVEAAMLSTVLAAISVRTG